MTEMKQSARRTEGWVSRGCLAGRWVGGLLDAVAALAMLASVRRGRSTPWPGAGSPSGS